MWRKFRKTGGGRSDRKKAASQGRRSFAARHTLPTLEALEDRRLMAVLYWDPNGPAAGVGGSGTWDNTSAFWTTDPNGLVGHGAWNDAAGDTAVFAGSVGTVTIDAADSGVSADGLQFDTAGYKLNSTGGDVLTMTGAATLVSASAALNLGTIINAPLAGTGGLHFSNSVAGTPDNTGIIELAGNNSALSGGLTIGDGIRVQTGAGTSALGASDITVNDGGQLFIFGGGTYTNALHLTGAGWEESAAGGNAFGALRLDNGVTWSGPIDLAADTAIGSVSGSGTLSGQISGAGKLTFNPASNRELFLTGTANDYTGGTVVQAGRVTLRANAKLGTGEVTVASGGQLFVSAANTLTNAFSIAGDGTNGPDTQPRGALRIEGGATLTGNITLTADASLGSYVGGTGIISGNISGPFDLAINKATSATPGVITLTGANSYIDTTITGGTLRIGNGGTTGTLGTGTIVNGGRLAFHRSDTTTLATSITGTGTVSVARGGTLELASGASIANRHLEAGDSSAAGLGAGTINILSGAAVNVESFYLGNRASQAGTVNQSGGTVSVTGSSGNVGDTTSGGLRIGHWPSETSSYNLSGGSLSVSGDLSVGWDGTGQFTQTGGTASAGRLVVNDGNSMNGAGSGTFTLSAGTFNLGPGGIATAGGPTSTQLAGGTLTATADWSTALPISLTGSATINTNGHDITINGSISGSGSLTKAGTGILTFGGNNSYAGTTTISAGTLQVGNGGTSGTLGGGDVTNDGSLVFDRGNSLTVPQLISGTGSVTQQGTGETTLTGPNTFTGDITVGSGTLIAAAGDNSPNATHGALGDGQAARTITVGANATLKFAADHVFGNQSSTPVTVIAVDGGTVTSADGTFNTLGPITLDGGTLDSGTPDANYGSFQLPAGLIVDGPGISRLDARGVTFPAGTDIAFTGDATLEQRGSTGAPLFGDIPFVVSGNGTAKDLRTQHQYTFSDASFNVGETSAQYTITNPIKIEQATVVAASLDEALRKAISLSFEVNGNTYTIGGGTKSNGFDTAAEPAELGTTSATIGFEDWSDNDYDDAYIHYSVIVADIPSVEDPLQCGCSCPCAPAAPDAQADSKTQAPGKLSPVYSSGSVNGNVVIRSTGQVRPGQGVPALVEVRLKFNGVDQPTTFYDPSALAPGDDYTIGMLADTSGLPTGRYDWEMTFISHYGDARFEESRSGTQDVVDRTQSEFGSGWWLPELDRLDVGAGGANLVGGTNDSIWFAETSGSYAVESGNPAIASLVKNGDNSFTLSYADGSQSQFDPAGQLASRTDSNGNQRSYTYADEDGDTVADELVSITDELGRTATFAYTAGMVSQITDFTGRTTSYAYTGGQLTSVTEADPDAAGPQTGPVTGYSYNAEGLLSKVTDPLLNESQLFYDFTGRVSSVEQACGGTTVLESFYTTGVADLATIGYDETHPAPLVATDDAVEYQEDERGNPTLIERDHWGNIIRSTDALGHVTRYLRDANGLVTRMIESDPDGAGPLGDLVTQFAYDTRGNVLQTIHPDGSSESFTYDPTFSQPTSHIDQLGRKTVYTIDPANGNLLSETRIVGLDDTASSETDDVTTSYTYTDGTGLPPAGLVETETDPLGRVTRYAYNSHGLVTSIVAAEGTADETTTSYEYDAADNLTAAIDPLGRRTEYAYDALDRMTQMTEPDPDGAGPLASPVWTYAYDARGNQRFVTDPLGNVTEYVYNERNWVEEKIEADPDGAGPLASPVTTFDYDCAGNLTSTTDPLGRTTTYSYDALNRLSTTTLPDPDGAGPLSSPVTSQTYDALGNVLTTTDALGNVTSYAYDALSRQISVTLPDPDGAGPLGSPVSQTAYDAAGQVISTTDPLARVTTYDYDDLGRQISVTLPDPDGAGPLTSPVTSTSFDKNGNVLTTTDALGNVTSYEYDALNRLIETTLPDPDGAGPLASPVMSSAYDAAGQLTSTTDALGRVTTYAYDALGRQTSRTLPDPDGAGSQTSPVFSISYDATGNVLSTTDALGNVTSYTYDNLYRQTQITQADPDGAGPLAAPVTSYEFDAAGQMVGMTDPEGRETTYSFDGLGRMIEQLSPDPDGAGSQLAPRMQYTFDAVGNLLTATDRLGNATSYAYDSLYRRTSETNANSETTSFAFDLVGNRTSLIDPEGNETTWAYDSLNRVIEETNELNATRYFSYDAVGNLIQKIDRNDRYTEYEYDNLYRQTEERWLDPTDDTTVIHTINWTYDAASQLTEAGDSFAEYDYTLDNLGRATSITATLAGLTPTVTLAQAFDANSRRTQLAATIGSTADFQNDYAYDALNRLTKITQQDVAGGNTLADKRVDLAYLADGKFDEINRYASLDTSEFVTNSQYGYDGTGRLSSLSHVQGSTTFAGYAWAYDAANRITSFTNSQYSAEDATYSYDQASQLTGADRTGTTNDEAYTFDDNGNRVTANGDSYTTGTNNRMSSDGTFNYTYDAEGNTLTKVRISNDPADDKTVEYTWDHRNRLASVSFKNNAGTLTQKVLYTYDAFDRLIGREVDTDGDADIDESSHFIFDDQHVALALSDSGTVQNRYLHGPLVDMVLADEQATGDVLWTLADNQNTIRDLAKYDAGTDTTTVENHRTYNAFGKITAETNAAIDSLFAYTGRILDEATGDQNHRARWYDSNTGKWLSEDPIGFAGGDANLTKYAGNDSINAHDATGLSKAKVIGWVVRRVGGRLVRVQAIYTEKQAAKLFLKKCAREGLDILVRDGKSQATRVAKIIQGIAGSKVTGGVLRGGEHGLGHFIQQLGRRGVPHVQLDWIANRHIFYGGLAALFAAATSEDASAGDITLDGDKYAISDVSAVYSDPYPGDSVFHALTISYWAGEDSWLSSADWVNPCEWMAMGGDLGRAADRELWKELIGVSVTITKNGTPFATVNVDPEGELISVGFWNGGKLADVLTPGDKQ